MIALFNGHLPPPTLQSLQLLTLGRSRQTICFSFVRSFSCFRAHCHHTGDPTGRLLLLTRTWSRTGFPPTNTVSYAWWHVQPSQKQCCHVFGQVLSRSTADRHRQSTDSAFKPLSNYRVLINNCMTRIHHAIHILENAALTLNQPGTTFWSLTVRNLFMADECRECFLW